LIALGLGANKIKEIKGFRYQKSLVHLELDGNKISEINGLDSLTRLSYLDLSHNKIKEVKGFDSSNLETLLLWGNPMPEAIITRYSKYKDKYNY